MTSARMPAASPDMLRLVKPELRAIVAAAGRSKRSQDAAAQAQAELDRRRHNRLARRIAKAA